MLPTLQHHLPPAPARTHLRPARRPDPTSTQHAAARIPPPPCAPPPLSPSFQSASIPIPLLPGRLPSPTPAPRAPPADDPHHEPTSGPPAVGRSPPCAPPAAGVLPSPVRRAPSSCLSPVRRLTRGRAHHHPSPAVAGRRDPRQRRTKESYSPELGCSPATFLPPHSPVAFLPALRPPSSRRSGRLPPHAPAATSHACRPTASLLPSAPLRPSRQSTGVRDDSILCKVH